MENVLEIVRTNPNMTIGIYLTGMNLKEYIGKCLEGSIESPIGRDGPILINPQLPLVKIEMECGEVAVYRSLEALPEDSVPCSCGDPEHYFVYIKKEES